MGRSLYKTKNHLSNWKFSEKVVGFLFSILLAIRSISAAYVLLYCECGNKVTILKAIHNRLKTLKRNHLL
jgi:hypothetical protein